MSDLNPYTFSMPAIPQPSRLADAVDEGPQPVRPRWPDLMSSAEFCRKTADARPRMYSGHGMMKHHSCATCRS